MKNKGIFLFVFLFGLSVTLIAQQTMQFDQIPYGISIEEFQSLYGGYYEHIYANSHMTEFVSLRAKFAELSGTDITGPYDVMGNTVKRLFLERYSDHNSSQWRIVAFFMIDSYSSKLFMVEKYDLLYDSQYHSTMENIISTATGTKPKRENTMFSNKYLYDRGLSNEGMTSIWNVKGETIILASGKFVKTSIATVIGYISDRYWYELVNIMQRNERNSNYR
jgi:hypothetical protein